ncbi:hypothetical protein N5P37_001561 [Trichoderma harzianum]|nr:hypothetical protein N5P37_001561 [Trichoderma harzianum]
MTRDPNGAMNPSAIPFIPLASPQPSFATRRTRKTRSTARTARYERGDALSSRGQVMSSEIGQGAHGSLFAHCFASFITQTGCKVPQVHAVANNTSGPTTSTSDRSVGHTITLSQPNVEASEKASSGLKSDQTKKEGSSAASNSIITSSGPNISNELAPELLEANVPQTYRISGGKIASDTNEGAVPVNGPQLISTEVVPALELRPPGQCPFFIYPVAPPLPSGSYSIYPHPPVLPVLPSPPPPPGPCIPLLHMIPCQITDVSTGQPLPDIYTPAYQVTYWSLPSFVMPNPRFQAQDQNLNPLQEEMNLITHGYSGHRPNHPRLLTQAVNVPACSDQVQTHSLSADEPTVALDGRHLAEIPSDKTFGVESQLPTFGWDCTLPSAVDGPQAGEENERAQQRPLQHDRHVLFSSEHHHNAINEPTQPDTDKRLIMMNWKKDASLFTMQPSTKPAAKYSKRVPASDRPSQNQAPAEVASWSQSKRWLSSETKERRAFQKMMLNLQFMKADQSPFIPKTPAELTKFKISLAEARQQKLAHEVSILEAKTRQKEMAKASGLALVSKPQVTLFNGRDMGDRLSPVFAAQNCFNKQDIAEVNGRVEWPSLAELKEEGDRRTRYGRYLPLPRINAAAFKISEGEQEHAYKADGTIL